MLTALNDMYVQGVETSIPLYKTILNSEEYKNGELSTDFLKRYGMIDRLSEDLKKEKEDKVKQLWLQQLFILNTSRVRVQNNNNSSATWKNKLD